jgi:prophage tail gpP-like protein
MSRIIVTNVTRGRELLWRKIKIRKSLDDICHTLELEIPKDERLNVGRHDRITVRYVNSIVREPYGLVTTVLVDEITANVDITKRSIVVLGRSPARDIIDSTWTDQVGSITLGQAAKKIGEKFNIDCVTFPTNEPDKTKIVHWFSWQDESPWAKLINAADINDDDRYILTSNEAGGLYVWTVAWAVRQEGFHLTEGQNIKTAEWKENGAEQYHTYVVTGGGESVTITDDTCRSNRVLNIGITDPLVSQEELKRKAETERNRRRENRTTVTVAGWGLTNQQIQYLGEIKDKEIFWVPNILIPVRIPSLGLSRNLLISEVDYEATPEAFGCVVTVVNREAYLNKEAHL